MTLRRQTLLIIATTIVGLLAALQATSGLILNRDFASLEARATREKARRFLQALQADITALDAMVKDWSEWDDTYEFIVSRDPGYVSSNLSNAGLVSNDLDFAIQVDPEGSVVLAVAATDESGESAPLPAGLDRPSLKGHALLEPHPDGLAGLLSINERTLLVAAHPILTSDGEGPSRGTQILARWLTKARTNRIAEIAGVKACILRPDDRSLPGNLVTHGPTRSTDEKIVVCPLDADTIAGYAVLTDLQERPAVACQVRTGREIYAQGKASMRLLSLTAGAACLIWSGLTLVLIERTVLARIARLSSGIRRIGARGDIHERLPVTGNDELSSLTEAVNKMLAAIDESNRQLQAKEELERAKEAAERANLAKSESLASMSHEIRTPLTSILGYADLLMDADQSPSERLNCLHTIRRNGEHLLNILNDILDLSKIEAGRLVLDMANASPHEVLKEVYLLLRQRAQDKNLSLETRHVGRIPRSIRTDATRLRQILINLVGNAIKFTREGSICIEVSMADAPDAARPRIQFAIIDTGIGMSPQQIAKLFSPFVQAEASTTRQYGGTGLGLTISRRLAQALGGDISVESNVGKGSKFIVAIETGPLAGVEMLDSTQASVETAVALQPNTELKNVRLTGRVLLADDGLDNQHLVSCMLRKVGLSVTVCENGRIACDRALDAQAAGQPFDLILMDMQMPVLDGYDATVQLRRQGYMHPIVALTANAMQGDRDKCRAVGCDDFLSKPIERAKLITTVASFCRPESPPKPPAAVGHEPHPPAGPGDPGYHTRLVRDFVSSLPGTIEDIRRLATARDTAALLNMLHEIRAQAAGYGLEAIQQCAERLGQTAQVTSDLKELEIVIQNLAGACHRARIGQGMT